MSDKPNYLKPAAVVAAAVLSVAAGAASANVTSNLPQQRLEQVQMLAQVASSGGETAWVLQNGGRASDQYEYSYHQSHWSHYSHQSHGSHSSHYSSSY